MNDTHASWSARLRGLAAPALAGTPLADTRAYGTAGAAEDARARAWIEEFRDDAGNRRAVDRPLLASMLGLKLEAAPGCTPDVALWYDVANGTRGAIALLRGGEGPLLPGTPVEPVGWDGADGIEVWSEAELAAVHALGNLALGRGAEGDLGLAERLDSAARWLMENVQPDNATNRPWAVHVFVDRWLRLGDIDAHLYAQTLLHNCRVGGGRRGGVDVFSACLLEDAGRRLGA